MRPSSSASSISFVKTPLPPITDNGSLFTSPVVFMTSMRTSNPRRRSRACSACQSASFEPREPITSCRDIRRSLLESKGIFRQLHRFGLAGLVKATHLVEDGMRDLFDGRHEQRLDRGFLFRCQWSKPLALARQLFTRDVVHVLLHGPDAWSKVHQTQLLLKLHDFRLHDQFGSFRLAFALANVRRDNRFEVVNVEKKDIFYLADRGLDVARHANIDEAGGTITPAPECFACALGSDDVIRRPG